MTRITDKEFINRLTSNDAAIDIKSEKTRAKLEKAGIKERDLARADVNNDGKISGEKELGELFKVVDRFDNDGSNRSIETTVVGDNPILGNIPTASGAAYEALKSEFDFNVAKNILRGPNSTKQNAGNIGEGSQVSLFDHPHHKKHGQPKKEYKTELRPLDHSYFQMGLWATASHKEKEAAISKALKEHGYSYDKEGLQKAAKDGDVDALKLFKRGDFPGLNKAYLSMVKEGNPTAVAAFLEAGMDPDVRDKEGRTPLMLAGNDETTDLLLNMNADVTAKDKYDRTALMLQSARDDSFLSLNLLEKTKAANAIDARDDKGRTALHYAASSGNVSSAQQLIQYYDADIDAQDNNKMTPLSMAVANNKLFLARILTEKDANPYGGYANGGEFPLTIAIRNDNKEMVQMLLENCPDMDLDMWEADTLQTPLDIAIENGKEEIVDLLQSRGAMTSADKQEELSALGR